MVSNWRVDEVWQDHHIGWMRRGVKAIRLRRMRSSSIEAAGYDLERRTLRIRYVHGSTYDYQAVPATVFKGVLAADSKGRFVNWSIKPYYRYARVN
jgi:hypothetical protein